jgi:hypothetical protein
LADESAYVEEQLPLAPAPAAAGSWYYCQDPAGYFPYVNSCNRPWMMVVPFSTGDVNPAPAR